MNSGTSHITAADAERLDEQDSLVSCRERFALPPGVIYLDGNSLGAMPKVLPARMQQALEQEWAVGLIRSWNSAGWYPAPQRVGARIAQLVGAQADEVIACDSTSINLFKVLVSALRLRPGRGRILSEVGNFPTDSYMARGVAELMKAELTLVPSEQVAQSIDDSVAVVMLTHVNYKSGRLHDMADITRRAHEAGALVIWDLSHTAGAVPCELNACAADFAVGCGYKYLNGGPGAPAFVFAARRHHAGLRQPLNGWLGHAAPFEFSEDYRAAKGMDAMLVGTSPQLSLIALEAALGAFDGVDMQALRKKSLALTDLFIRLVDQEVHGFELITPREDALRGSQVSFSHEQGYAIMQALIARGVIGDFRAPDILRFGFAALYVRYIDVWNAVAILKDIMLKREWERSEFLQRKAVT